MQLREFRVYMQMLKSSAYHIVMTALFYNSMRLGANIVHS